MKIDRRQFLIGAGSVASLAWAPTRTALAGSADGSQLLIDADMEVSNIAEYETYGDSTNLQFRTHGNAPVISTDRARVGTKSMKSYLNRLTSSQSTYRSELEAIGAARGLEWRKTYWIGFSIYVPSDWRKDSASGEVLFQIHDWPDDWANAKTPPVCIRTSANSDRWRLRILYLTVPEDTATDSDLVTAVDDKTQLIATGKWTDWVFQYRPDWRLIKDGGVGLTRIWKDGVKVVDYAGPNAYNENKGLYLNFGCYKSAWRDSAFVDPVVERVYYHDEFRVSRPDVGSYNLVAPGAGTAAAPKPPSLVEVA